MCGINGIISGRKDILRKIPVMNDLLKHRGPDDEGYVAINSKTGDFTRYSGDDSIPSVKTKYPDIKNSDLSKTDIAFGHRRLSIIDLTENGHGPMSTLDGRVWITYNGEIYNYIELREELKSKGFSFATASDTEVIINAYLCWGTDCLNRFNGMWAFAIWDSTNCQLFLARDRFGVKPLYYTLEPDFFAFSSEIKPLLTLLGKRAEVNSEKIPFFILYGNRLNSIDTYINQVNSLPASHFLIYKEGKTELKRYYDVPVESEQSENETELQNKIVELLRDSIKLRFRSDVPVGTCLSGGFDSSSIVSLSNTPVQKGLNTFSAVWNESDCDESKYIDLVNSRFNCTPNKVIPGAEYFDSVFSKLSYHQEIPTEGPGLYPQWFVMEKAMGKVKVLLDGQGGDEVFGGYFLLGSFLRGLVEDRSILRILRETRSFVSFLNKQGMHSFTGWLFPKHYNRIAGTWLSGRFNIIKKSILEKTGKDKLLFDIDPPKKFKGYLNNLSYHFLTNITIPALLHYEDRSSMAHSIESRVPFLDYRLVELGLNLNAKFLNQRQNSRPLYRKALKPFIPEEIVNRTDKLGFPTPFEKWSRAVLKDYITDKLLPANNLIYDYVDAGSLKLILSNHFNDSKNYSWEIWRLMSLECSLSMYRSFRNDSET